MYRVLHHVARANSSSPASLSVSHPVKVSTIAPASPTFPSQASRRSMLNGSKPERSSTNMSTNTKMTTRSLTLGKADTISIANPRREAGFLRACSYHSSSHQEIIHINHSNSIIFISWLISSNSPLCLKKSRILWCLVFELSEESVLPVFPE